METCFVIQPFDKGNFDDRYKDTFEPAIKEADLEPYRVDKDFSVRIPIDTIEENILIPVLNYKINNNNFEQGKAYKLKNVIKHILRDY